MSDSIKPKAQDIDPVTEFVLSLAQAKLAFAPLKETNTVKTKTYSYNYANLSDVYNSVSKALAENSLIITHKFVELDGKNYLTTSLIHAAGHAIHSHQQCPMLDNPQDYKKKVTYLQRIAVLGLLGIAPASDDDDAQSAIITSENPQRPVTTSGAPKPSLDIAKAKDLAIKRLKDCTTLQQLEEQFDRILKGVDWGDKALMQINEVHDEQRQRLEE